MSRDELLKILKTFKENNAEKYDITALGLFGSAVRDENQKESDVDVVVKLK
ncbi:MAG: nucleotidyltransferase domain-containing protein, partial [Planctomycetes bacterium]|nr:nucleotidyltransferase domain-containing protein [Planctomycetota bacterium]